MTTGEPTEPLTDGSDDTPASKRQKIPTSDEPAPPSSPPCATPARPVDSVVKPVSSDVTPMIVGGIEWPGLPRGVKFDPSDEDLLWHLLAKVGKGEAEPHPLISEFIVSLDEDDEFGYTHPLRLAGVKQDGSVSYFFHRSFEAFNSEDKKCQKMQDADFGVVFWHKIDKTKPVIIDGIHEGCKKIMVLYVVMRKGEKPEKTNWVMQQYHLGRGEGGEGEFVVSKIFYQQNSRQSDKITEYLTLETAEAVIMEGEAAVGPISPVPKIHADNQHVDLVSMEASDQVARDHNTGEENHTHTEYEELDKCNSLSKEDPKGEEIALLDSQQHVEGTVTYDDMYQTPISCVAEAEMSISCTSDIALIGGRTLEEGSRECQNDESSTQCRNVDSAMDYTSEFTTNEIFKSREAIIKWTRDRGRMNGFAIVIKVSQMGGHGRKPRLIFGCERGGKYRIHHKNKEESGKRKRMTSTKKCECPFSLKGNKLATEDDWTLVVECGVHNHPATEHLEGNSYAGRLSQEETLLVVDLYNNSVRPKDILTILKQRDPLNMATVRTIYNAHQKSKQLLKAGKQMHQPAIECETDPVGSTTN